MQANKPFQVLADQLAQAMYDLQVKLAANRENPGVPYHLMEAIEHARTAMRHVLTADQINSSNYAKGVL
jgi:hypothetical protein